MLMKEISYIKPIPAKKEPLPYDENNFVESEFVEIITDDNFDVSMQYPRMGMHNAEKKCLLRKEVYERLFQAAKKLPQGYKIRILDAWRSFALQEELYEKYSSEIISRYGLEEVNSDERKAIIKKFVSEPQNNRVYPPVHTTGGAVDVTLLDEFGKELNMGTAFDSFENKAYTDYFERQDNQEIKNNRRLLYSIMIGSGFTNLPSEWWHYDYGDQFWAYYSNRPAIYMGIFTLEEIYGN